jgi:hypothetical protein
LKKTAPFAIALFSFAALFSSCKKSGTATATYSMTATVAGVQKSFDFEPPIAATSSAGGSTYIFITGIKSASGGEQMVIQLSTASGGGPIVAGTYYDTVQNFLIAANYALNANTIYVAGTVVAEFASISGIAIVNHLKVVITSINSTAIKGTFSGDFYVNGNPALGKIPITNGNFYAKFQP